MSTAQLKTIEQRLLWLSHPATLFWLGAVAGHKTIPHGVEHFGQTGSIFDLASHFQIDRNAIANSVSELTVGDRSPGAALSSLWIGT